MSNINTMDKKTKILTELEATQKLVRIVEVSQEGYLNIATGIVSFNNADNKTITIENIHTPKKTLKVKAIKTIEVMTEVWNKGYDNGATESN